MIELKNVNKFYNNNGITNIGLHNISLSLSKNEIVAITGESGSGKSTLLNVITKIDNFDEGEIYYTNNEHSIYKITRSWESVKLCGKARGIGIGPFNQAFIIGKDYNVYTSSKSSCFN